MDHSEESANKDQEAKPQPNSSDKGFVIAKSNEQPKLVLTDPNEKLNGCQINGIYNCQMAPANRLAEFFNSNPNSALKISIPEYKIIDEGLFKSKYVTFIVSTPQLSAEVSRRFNDFLWLKTQLQKQFPTHYLPNVSKKKAYRSFDDLYLTKRRKVLEKFLEYISKDKLLRSSAIVEDFLVIGDAHIYKQKQKEAESKIVAPTKISDYTTLNGEITLEVSNKLKAYSRNLNQNTNSADAVYDKLKKNSKVLIQEFDQLSRSLLSASQCYESLEKLMPSFSEDTKLAEIKSSEKIYCVVKLLFATWSQCFED